MRDVGFDSATRYNAEKRAGSGLRCLRTTKDDSNLGDPAQHGKRFTANS